MARPPAKPIATPPDCLARRCRSTRGRGDAATAGRSESGARPFLRVTASPRPPRLRLPVPASTSSWPGGTQRNGTFRNTFESVPCSIPATVRAPGCLAVTATGGNSDISPSSIRASTYPSNTHPPAAGAQRTRHLRGICKPLFCRYLHGPCLRMSRFVLAF